MKRNLQTILFFMALGPQFLNGQNIVFSYEVETVSSTESMVKVYAHEKNGGTENLVGFTVDFYYDNTESTLTAFDFTPLTSLGWSVNQSQVLHDPTTNMAVPITHTGFGTTNVFDDNFSGTSIGSVLQHVLTLHFNHSVGTPAASEGFLASTANNRPALAYSEFDGSNFFEHPVVVTGPAAQSLPVELLYFQTRAEGGMAFLEWATVSETNSDIFEIEHSIDGVLFKKIGQKQAATFSRSALNYDFLHQNPLNGKNYYRLKMKDLDGSFEYSGIRSEYFRNLENLATIYPNPTTDILNIRFLQNVEEGKIELFNELGQSVLETMMNHADDTTILVGEFAPGVYSLHIETGGKSQFERLIIGE